MGRAEQIHGCDDVRPGSANRKMDRQCPGYSTQPANQHSGIMQKCLRAPEQNDHVEGKAIKKNLALTTSSSESVSLLPHADRTKRYGVSRTTLQLVQKGSEIRRGKREHTSVTVDPLRIR